MKYFLIIILTGSLTFNSCKSIKEAKRLENCDFAFSHISSTELGGVRIQDKEEFRDLGFGEMALITKAFLAKDLLLTFTAYISIRNPNRKTAALNRLDWKMLVEGDHIAEGVIDDRFEVLGGTITSIPVKVEIDVLEIWKSKNKENIMNLLFNLSDLGGRPTLLTIKVKPSVVIAGKMVKTPNYFTINSEFGN